MATVGDVTLPIMAVDPKAAPNDAFVYVDIGSIDNRLNRITDPKSLYGRAAPSRARQLLLTGDTLVSTVRTYLRNIGFVETSLSGAIGSTGFSVLRPAQGVNPRLLYYYALTNSFVNGLSAQMRGTSYPAVVESQVRSMPMPVPPTAEQERIVAAIEEQFSRLDVGVAALEDCRHDLMRMRVSVRQGAFSAADATVDEWIQLRDILREPLRNGHSAKADSAGSVRIWTLTAVTYGDFSMRNTKVTAADPGRVAGLWVQPGDLLIERSNTRELVGTTRLYQGSPSVAIYPDLVIRARVSEAALPQFVELMLQAPTARRYFQMRARGISGSMPKIDQAAIESFSLPLPSLESQSAIVLWTNGQVAGIKMLEQSLAVALTRASKLRSSILAAAFSGRLVEQDPRDEPASLLLQRITAERASTNGYNATHPRKTRITPTRAPV
jgi:type I restriction enzyme, S subunit